MIPARTDLNPANWQITATTIQCDYVHEAITLMVDKDWTVRCTWYRRYKQKALEDNKKKFEKAIRLKMENCLGTECPLALNYRNKLMQEEPGNK